MKLSDDLRQSVLQAAIEGKLTKQLESDGSSIDLIKRADAISINGAINGVKVKNKIIKEFNKMDVELSIPDNWEFAGSISDQYKQIGNAVPVNLAFAIGRSLIRLFNDIDALNPEETQFEEANRIAHGMLPPQLFEVNMFDMHEQYPNDANIVINPFKREKRIRNSSLNDSKNVLVCYVPDKYLVPYTNKRAKTYFTGKKFPSTVKLNKLYYFMPYAKGKGIRDLYQIEVARVGTKHEFEVEAEENDFRLVFEIKFVKQLFDDYKPIKLMIWHTFTDTNLRAILSL